MLTCRDTAEGVQYLWALCKLLLEDGRLVTL